MINVMFSRIVITSDLLRPFPVGVGFESCTKKPVRWLYEILSPAFRRLGLPVTVLSWDDELSPEVCHYFDTPACYHKLSLPLSVSEWAKLSILSDVPDAFLEVLRSSLSDALVIG